MSGLRIPGKINQEPDLSKQFQIAAAGRTLTPFEISAMAFLEMERAMEWADAPQEFREKLYQKVCIQFLGEFRMLAEQKKLPESLRALADLLGEREKTGNHAADPHRAILLHMKLLLAKEPPITKETLAERMNYKGNLDVLARDAKDIGIILKKTPFLRPPTVTGKNGAE